jgi:hypothetical protein
VPTFEKPLYYKDLRKKTKIELKNPTLSCSHQVQPLRMHARFWSTDWASLATSEKTWKQQLKPNQKTPFAAKLRRTGMLCLLKQTGTSCCI